jgi:hypothetical protein
VLDAIARQHPLARPLPATEPTVLLEEAPR